jgi:hypothetical protein
MTRFFPRTSINWQLEEPAAIRRFSLWIVPMALVTGIVIRGVRASMLTNLDQSLTSLGFYYGLTGLLYLSSLTAHVGNYPLRKWLWRVPAFALIEAAAESLASAALISAGREPMGTAMATWSDWSTLAFGGLWYRLIVAIGYGLLLAGIVLLVRTTFLEKEQVEVMEVEGDRETGELRRESIEQVSGAFHRVTK